MQQPATYLPLVNNTLKKHLEKLVSDRDLYIYLLVNLHIISSAVALFGIVANVLNAIVFHKQGFDNTINISLFGLTISDLCSQISVLWSSVVLSGFLDTLGLSINMYEVVYLTGGHVRICFARITSWITVFITAERCLCITFPLKIKQIVTPRRTKVILCVIFVSMVLSIQSEYVAAYLDWGFDDNRNKTVLGLMFTSKKQSLEGLSFFLYSVLGFASFIIVIIFTLILVFRLKQKSKWRQKATNEAASRSETTSKKDQRTIPMVVMIATVLIICYTPSVVVSMVTVVVPELSIRGLYLNAFFVLWSFVYVFEAFNSSVNIFLYYYMSSKFRETFQRIFRVGKSH